MFVQTKIAATLLLVAMSSVFVQASVECPTICPELFAPVCATNGETYTEFDNSCILKSINCDLKKNQYKLYEKVDLDWCRTKPARDITAIIGNMDTNRKECMKACTYIYLPVCVSNGKQRTTLPSKCVMDVYNCNLNLNGFQTLRILREGKC